MIITRHDKPVARLVPECGRNLKAMRAAVAGLFELRGQISDQYQGIPEITPEEVKSWIGEGRR